MACYYIVISSTHLSNGHLRNIKGVFRGPLCRSGTKTLEKEKTLALEDLRANFYCQLCDKQYYKHQEFDNHINSYDHAHKQRLKELKQREFARNVASRSWKDVRREERALLRLHQLAEQCREAQWAPGSGPMFKSTTVAVESSCRDTCCADPQEEMLGVSREEAQTTVGTSCLASKQIPWQHGAKAKKQTLQRKIAFSFSFPKKASVKLESSAAVFCESMEEGPSEGIRTPLIELDLVDSPGEGKRLDGEEACPCAEEQHGEQSPNPSETWSQGSQEASVGRADLQHASPDLCAFLVYSEDMSVSPSPHGPRIVLNLENTMETTMETTVETTIKATVKTPVETPVETSTAEQKATLSPNGAEDKDLCLSVPLLNTSSDESPGNVSVKGAGANESLCAQALTPFTKPLLPFLSVLGRDNKTIFQWPSEMVSFTATQPSLSFSCNPLHFDFRGTRRGPNTQTGEEPSPSGPQRPSMEEASPSHGVEGAGRKSKRYHTNTGSGERRTECIRRRLSREQTQTRRRAVDRRHYRSKQRHKRRRRQSEEEDCGPADQSESGMQKWMKFHRRGESRERLDSQFRYATSHQEQPLEKSQQSTPNQAGNRRASPAAVEESGCGKREASAGASCTAGDSHESNCDTVLRNSKETAWCDTVGETAIVSHASPHTPPHVHLSNHNSQGRLVPSAWRHRDVSWEGQAQKRGRRDIQGSEEEEEEEAGSKPDSSTEDNQHEDGKYSCSTRRRKRPKLDQILSETSHLNNKYTEDRGTEDRGTEDTGTEDTGTEDRGTEDTGTEDKDMEQLITHCCLLKEEHGSSSGPEQISCRIDDGVSGAVDCQTQSVSGQTGADNSCCQLHPDPSQLSSLHRQHTLPLSGILGAEWRARLPAVKGKKRAVAVQVCAEIIPATVERASYNKVCEPGLQVRGKDGSLVLEGSYPSRGPFCATSHLQSRSASLERHHLLCAHTHTHPLHQRVFTTKLKPILPRLALPVASPMLHPVHLPPAPITILQHHTPFLPPQPPLFPQVVPVTRLPLGPDGCPPAATPFVTPSQMSVVAPASIHPPAMTFHALPRPAIFSPILHRPAFSPVLPTHPAVLPLF